MRPLTQSFSRIDIPFALRLWNGETRHVGGAHSGQASPLFTLVCNDPTVVRSMIFGHDSLLLAQAPI
jgi:hypothetical protein